jgi:hypothetical protein
MSRPALEVADIFRRHTRAYREAHCDSLSRGQRRVMSAIECCRTSALGGHLEQCNACGYQRNAFNSCRNRHCPKCQSLARAQWLEEREAELLDCEYFHVVFTIPQQLALIAFQNKPIVYDIVFRATAETLTTIAADPQHLGARIGFMALLHTWGQTLMHHPHLHCVVPGGGLSPDGARWVACPKGFFLPVKVLSRLFRRLFLAQLQRAFDAGKLQFFAQLEPLADAHAFARYLAPLNSAEWVVYAKRPFAGPAAVLAYLSRYTHRVAISNSRLLALDERGVTFRYKDYRSKGKTRYKAMTLTADEFIRRFLLHVLPIGFHRIRHYGWLANAGRREHLAQARQLLEVTAAVDAPSCKHASTTIVPPTFVCPHCGAAMRVVEAFARRPSIRGPPPLRAAA